jgi:hypothetical protein
MTGLDATAFEQLNLNVFPNPTTDLIAIQASGLVSDDLTVELIDIMGKVIKSTIIHKGQTVAYFDVKTVYNGTYFVKITNGTNVKTEKIVINR